MSQDCINELINFTVKLAAWLTDWPTYQTSDQTTAWQKFTENEERSPQETLLKINFEELLNAKESICFQFKPPFHNRFHAGQISQDTQRSLCNI